ncbi:hypothetical protein PG993_004046 [Apiospora rasikravindrae]|uniref:Peptidase S8/S53 domain-containing protein n=1 Tax=Apiospora rasikravindrae TaxID=990691 RepID=A0ABR1TBN8_9PEZI
MEPSHDRYVGDQQKEDVPDIPGDTDTTDDEDEEQEDEGWNERKQLIRIISELKKICDKEIKNGQSTPTEEQRRDIEELISKNEAHIQKSPGSAKQNLLHLLAEEPIATSPPMMYLQPFITGLVHKHGDLLAGTDEFGNTPLHRAIFRRRRELAKCMCEAHKDIDQILRIPTIKSANCLHLAIEKRHATKNDDTLLWLIDNSGEETLCAANDEGLTPLHLAVAYNLCDATQLGIVQRLVNKCDRALEVDKSAMAGDPGSPYCYHVSTTRKAALKRSQSAEGTGSKGKRVEKPPAKTVKKDDFPAEKYMPSLEEKRNRVHQSPIQKDVSEEPTGKYTEALRPGKSFITRSATGEVPPSPITPVQSVNGDARQAKHAFRIPYIINGQAERQISLDLMNPNYIIGSISESQITQGLDHQTFEDVLQYISIPQLRVEQTAVTSKREQGQRLARSQGTGRTDLLSIFKWITKEKHVQAVFKVIVDDLGEVPHQDQAIEDCLQSITGLETWDWKKFDLSPDVIHTAAPDARVVHVYWSGNNAVLRAWSEPEGLRKLKKLEEVHLYKKQAKAFIKRLEEDKSIRVIEKDLKGVNPTQANGPTYSVKEEFGRHRWVEIMENFADFLRNAESSAIPQVTLKEPIKIAVIDDGVNTFDPTIDFKVAGGRSFSYRDDGKTLVNSYFASSEGHGTAMAGFIRKVCPNVELYSLRLDEPPVDTGRRHFTAASANKAVRDAIKKQVHIISMSWTIEKTSSNEKDVEELERAIAEADAKHILMFCAASDGGAQGDNTYPAATARTKNIFKIGAAKAAGTATDWVKETPVDFIFPGHQVVQERYGDPGVTKYTQKTGSSVATALASGLAALILYCVQLGAVAREKNGSGGMTHLNLEAYHSLKSHERMKRAFMGIGTNDDNYIRVWDRFEKPVQEARKPDSKREEWIRLVETLAEKFVPPRH